MKVPNQILRVLTGEHFVPSQVFEENTLSSK